MNQFYRTNSFKINFCPLRTKLFTKSQKWFQTQIDFNRFMWYCLELNLSLELILTWSYYL